MALAVRALVDTSVLVSDLLWLGLLTMRQLGGGRGGGWGGPQGCGALELFTTSAILEELRPALRRVYRERTRLQIGCAFEARRQSLRHLDMASMDMTRRGFVKDPDDAHLDVAAWQGRMDVLVSNDVRAFKPVSSHLDEKAERGYELVTGDALLVRLWDAQAGACRAQFVDTWRGLYEQYCQACGLEPDRRAVSEQFRRARAFKLAKRLKGLG
ncbi:PIN domain-containing protein [Brevibacterium sp. UMB10442]|nr:PIN domain-containing protein [Brevibacterium sp. UMB10442]